MKSKKKKKRRMSKWSQEEHSDRTEQTEENLFAVQSIFSRKRKEKRRSWRIKHTHICRKIRAHTYANSLTELNKLTTTTKERKCDGKRRNRTGTCSCCVVAAAAVAVAAAAAADRYVVYFVCALCRSPRSLSIYVYVFVCDPFQGVYTNTATTKPSQRHSCWHIHTKTLATFYICIPINNVWQ